MDARPWTFVTPVVVAFGDSNTWGFSPGAGARMAREIRWPVVMAQALGPSFQVIEESLCGRTTVFEDPEEEGRNGLAYFAPCLRSHALLDLVIISLGCNDVKARFAASTGTVAAGAERLIEVALAPRPALTAPRPKPTWSRRRRSKSSPNTPRCSRAGRKRRFGSRPSTGRSPNGGRRLRRRGAVHPLLAARRHPLCPGPARRSRRDDGGGGAHDAGVRRGLRAHSALPAVPLYR